jgi:hypothetical protein
MAAASFPKQVTTVDRGYFDMPVRRPQQQQLADGLITVPRTEYESLLVTAHRYGPVCLLQSASMLAGWLVSRPQRNAYMYQTDATATTQLPFARA